VHECVADVVGLIGREEEMGWMRWNHSIAKIITDPQLEFGWSVSCALGCSTSAESDEKGEDKAAKREIAVLKFYKP